MSRPSDQDTVEARVLRVVKEVLSLDEDPPDLDRAMKCELALDSLQQLSLFMALEDEFDARIPEEDAENIHTLRDVVEYVRVRMSATDAG